MLNLINTAEHAYATAARDMVNAWHFVRLKILPAMHGIEADAPIIEAITKAVDPEAVNVERTAFAIIGLLADALDKVPESNGALNVTVDGEILDRLKAVRNILRGSVHPNLLATPAAVPATPVK